MYGPDPLLFIMKILDPRPNTYDKELQYTSRLYFLVVVAGNSLSEEREWRLEEDSFGGCRAKTTDKHEIIPYSIMNQSVQYLGMTTKLHFLSNSAGAWKNLPAVISVPITYFYFTVPIPKNVIQIKFGKIINIKFSAKIGLCGLLFCK